MKVTPIKVPDDLPAADAELSTDEMDV